MVNFVPVHGAWQTAATWDLSAPKLREEGHFVCVPHLAGLENDGSPLSPKIGLQTHIDDVLAALSS